MDGTGAVKEQLQPRRADGRGDHPAWSRFEALRVTESGAGGTTGSVDSPSSASATGPVAPGARSTLRRAPRLQGPVAETRPEKAQRPDAAKSPSRHGPWRHRFEGAAMMAALTLAAFTAGWLHGSITAAPAAVPEATTAEALGQAGADADSRFATADAAMVAAIAAANPPYLVRLHVAEGTAARDVARLMTALTAWGFKAPHRIAAAEPVSMAEVRFHDAADREAARVLGAVAGRLLGEAALTPPAPQLGAGLEDALASLAGPADSAAAQPTDPAPAAAGAPSPRVLDLFVPAQ